MTTSRLRDAELKRIIIKYEAKKEKYERVRNAISGYSLEYQRNLSGINHFIERTQTTVDKLNGNDGYMTYLSTFHSKLTADKKTMAEYRDFIRDANAAFVNLYDTLEDKISALNRSISSAKAEFNEGHIPFLDEYYFW